MIALEDIKVRLKMIGYDEVDDELISYIKTTKEIDVKGQINSCNIPEELDNVLIDMICGEYLLTLKNSGQELAVDIDSAASAITEGDTKVELAFAKGMTTAEQRFDELIGYLLRGERRLIEHRRMRW